MFGIFVLRQGHTSGQTLDHHPDVSKSIMLLYSHTRIVPSARQYGLEYSLWWAVSFSQLLIVASAEIPHMSIVCLEHQTLVTEGYRLTSYRVTCLRQGRAELTFARKLQSAVQTMVCALGEYV